METQEERERRILENFQSAVIVGTVRSRTWSQPRVIDSLPPGHPDRIVRSTDEAARVCDRHGLMLHPCDASGTHCERGVAPEDPRPLTAAAFGSSLPIDLARARRKRIISPITPEQAKKNLAALLRPPTI